MSRPCLPPGQISKRTCRQRSLMLHPLTLPCEGCGATEKIQRHHDDYQKPEEVRFLCPTCHAQVHIKQGTWGPQSEKNVGNRNNHPPRGRKVKTCQICGTEFTHGHSKAKVCSRDCLTEISRRGALKRWKPQDSSVDVGEATP